MSLPISKKNIVGFVIKQLLVLGIISAGVALLFYNKENVSYIKQKQQRVTGLIELNDILQKSSYAYLNLINADSVQIANLKENLKTLADKKRILEMFDKEDEMYKNEAAAVQSSLNEEENLYNSQLVQLPQNFRAGFNKKIGATQPLLIQLVKLEREDLEFRTIQNDGYYQKISYLVIVGGILALIMNFLLYYRSQKSLKRQMAHERETHNAKLMAQSANNAKSEYLAMISHEIRTPMNGVLGMSNLLLQGTLTEEQKEYAKTIHNSAESLLRIVNDVLDFSTIEAGKIQLNQIAIDIRQLISAVFSTLPKSSIYLAVRYSVDSNVPQFIKCDPVRLKQILLNFLSNAVKFTEKGSISLECKVIGRNEDGNIRLGFVIKDTGIGIAEERIKFLFRPFVQENHTTIRKYGGTGLGLNIAYNLIAMMDGKVKVSSQVGKGSTFTFFITTKAVANTQKSVSITEKDKSMLNNALSDIYPLRILVVDDNEINLMLITKTLGKLGYDCKRGSNGQIAIDMVKQDQFDIIFMDMQMPIMDGTVATTEIRKFYKIYEYPVVIALTANALNDGKEKCLEAGMQDFIAKPFKPAEIEEVIKKWGPKIISYKEKHQSIFLS